MLHPWCFSNAKIRHRIRYGDSPRHCEGESHVSLQYLELAVPWWTQFNTAEVDNHCTFLLSSRYQKTGELPGDNAALRARQGLESTEYLIKLTILVKVNILLFMSQLNFHALLHEKDLFSLSFFLSTGTSKLHNLIASLDKYPALAELTCTANMPARQYTDDLNPDR